MNKHELKQLKKQLIKNQQAEKLAEKKVRIETIQEKHEQYLFLDAMSGVSPLTQDKNVLHEKRPKTKKINYSEYTEEDDFIFHDPLSDELEVDDTESEEVLSFCETGIQKATFKKLRSGRYRISDELDLHGASLKQAKAILVYYLQEAVQFEGCCIRIIHGKGNRSGSKKPVLKTHVNHWLIEHERVLAFHSAKPQDGGTGAVYVLLRSQ